MVGLARLRRPWRLLFSAGLLVAAAVACAQDVQDVRLPGFGPRVFGDRPTVAQMEALGAKLFADPGLSASGKMACVSCHSPAHSFSPPNRLSTQLGGAAMAAPGHRNPPSLMYLQATIGFTEHFIDDEDGHGEDAGPTGGLNLDGRSNSIHEQALIPLFAVHEMANVNPAVLAQRLRRSAYAVDFRSAFSEPGHDVFDAPEQLLGWLTSALEIYQQSAPTFYPFTSKYDAVLRRQASFSPVEARGRDLFNNPAKGNCASCHPGTIRSDGGFPLFTDMGHIALGVPRNPQITANHNLRYFDMGLCGPDRADLAATPEDCGRFKAPSLRNVAGRGSFFHNGRFHGLREVVEFYATRDTNPARWYPRGRDGQVRKFDDLPKHLRTNVNTEAPFLPLPGNKPRLNRTEIDAMVAFLSTLSDGYQPPTRTKSISPPPAELPRSSRP